MIPWLFQDLLKRIGKWLPKVSLVLDALGECDNMNGLLSLLRDLGSIQTTTFQIILASRDINSIRSLLSRMTKGNMYGIRLSPDQIQGDLEFFIRREVETLDIRDLGSEDEAAKKLAKGSDSTFLLAHLRVGSLRRKKIHTHLDFENALSGLPQGLSKFYDKTFENLQRLTNRRRSTVRRIFMWVIYAKRQLNFRELAEAVSVPSRDGGHSHGKLTQQGLDALCGGLLTFTRPKDDSNDSQALIGLANSTMKEYILDFVWNIVPPSPCLRDSVACHSGMAQVALTYMNGLNTQQLDEFPLVGYVYKYWILHLLDSDKPTLRLTEDLAHFLGSLFGGICPCLRL